MSEHTASAAGFWDETSTTIIISIIGTAVGSLFGNALRSRSGHDALAQDFGRLIPPTPT